MRVRVFVCARDSESVAPTQRVYVFVYACGSEAVAPTWCVRLYMYVYVYLFSRVIISSWNPHVVCKCVCDTRDYEAVAPIQCVFVYVYV